jgi:hypothetical protein
MAPTPKDTPSKIEFQPSPFINLYTMFYRLGTNHLQSKNFRHNGNLSSARERAEKHCNILGAKIMFVQPLISDLNKEEEYALGFSRPSTIEEPKEKL